MTYYWRFVDLFLATYWYNGNYCNSRRAWKEKKNKMRETERERKKRRRGKRQGSQEKEEKERQHGSFFHDEKTVSPIVDRYPSWNNRDNEKATQPKSFVLFSLFLRLCNTDFLHVFRFGLRISSLLAAPTESPAFPLSFWPYDFHRRCHWHASLAITLNKNWKEPQLSPSIDVPILLDATFKTKKQTAHRDV